MKLALGAAALIVGMALVAAACGSGGQQADDDEYTGTVRSNRQEREASVMQQQQDAGVDSGIGDGVEATGVIDFGHREGLAFLRNSVGDPEAPVLIVEYSDFQ